ncbi:ferredoxin [Rhodococcus wratislaviensis]|uniref:ferredoxin n=1 Tax=Rhodococcus wratislaviensis TaxID=44752 RepID=UPI003512C576
MHIDVDMTFCQDHGQCVMVAPEVFRFNSDGNLEYSETPSLAGDLIDRVEEAADICPVQAIIISRAAS